jgi:hypothetical protein
MILAGLVSGDRLDFADVTNLDVDPATGPPVVSVALPHFSRLVIQVGGSAASQVDLTPASIPAVIVGEGFDLTATIHNRLTGDEIVENLLPLYAAAGLTRPTDLSVVPSGRWSSEVLWLRDEGPIVPASLETFEEFTQPDGEHSAFSDVVLKGTSRSPSRHPSFFFYGRGNLGTLWLPDASASGECVFGEKVIRDLRGAVERTPLGFGTTFLARFRGSVVDLSNLPVGRADVTVTLTAPDGTTDEQTVTTGADGRFTFVLGSNTDGTFSIDVTLITCLDGTMVESSRSTSADTSP